MALSPNELVALLVAISFAAGLNVYATVATLGMAGRLGWLALPGSLDVVTSWWVIGACAVIYLIEFVADKIPVFDLIWNALQTFVRVPVGAWLAYLASAQLGPGWQLAATAAGGVIAFAAHSAKMAARAAVTPSPEPVSNFVLSIAEDAFAIFIVWFATEHPYIAAAIVVILLVLIVILIRLVIRGMRWMFGAASRQYRQLSARA